MEFRILGPIEVLDDGVPVDLGAPKQRAVLAVLLLHVNEVVPADQLVDLVWGEDPPRTAAHSVQIYVSELRKAFQGNGELIATRRPGYELQTDVETIDARRFERLVGEATEASALGDRAAAGAAAEQALGLWGGSALADFAYDDFAQREIERLSELHQRAVATLCEVHISGGRPLEAVPMLRDAVSDDPLREEPRRLLMLALFAGGRQAEALREFRDYRDTLAEATGLDPSPELLRLEEQILLRDPSLVVQPNEPVPEHVVERNLYKGLRAFGEGDATDFFGRDELIERLRVASASPLTAVVGPSGSGKSSAVRAGLIPALRKGAPSGSHDWTIVTIMPGRYPFAEFDAAIARVSGTAVGASDPNDDASITRSILRSLPAESGLMMLVVDQFEELFTLTDEATRRAFLRNLVTAIGDPRGRIRALLTVRADFYDQPMLYPEFAKLFTDNVVNVIPLTPAGIEAAAVGPAQRVGVGFAPNLLAELVSDMTNQPGALPLFQYTLTELFDERDNSTMTLDGYRRIGGLAGALSRRADAVFASLDPDEQKTTRNVFLRLVKPTDDRYTRRPVPILELELIGDPVMVSIVMAKFGDERLLTFDRDSQTGAATAEVSHEALLEGWGRLADWLEEARLDLSELDGLMISASEWETVERDSGYLLSGARLTDYEAWQGSTSIALPPSAFAYLTASTEARQKTEQAEVVRIGREARATRRARVRLWGMLAAIVALVAVITFVVATAIANRPPAVAFLFEGPGDEGFNDQMLNGVETAMEEFSLDVAVRTSNERGVGRELAAVAESAPELVIIGLNSLDGMEAREVELAHPEINFVHPDVGSLMTQAELDAVPHVSFPVFPAHQGSFLVGVAAARMTQTRIVGFIGGVDLPIIREFEAGFVGGIEWVEDEDGVEIEVLVEYITPFWDSGGFAVPSFGMETALGMHAQNADVIYSAAGWSGFGALQAAAMSTAQTGVHRWHIGVDRDEYANTTKNGDEEAQALLPHILTSMTKRIDVSLYQALEDYDNGVFESGIREYGLAEGGVGYVTTGGYIDHLVPELERLRLMIINGEIDVPRFPVGYELPTFDEVG
jgi:basic membrane lipoprotein Med (substrate-binding protein (PBP1-ABC) superfamily)/DNA-binding SARP family transcriptional activator